MAARKFEMFVLLLMVMASFSTVECYMKCLTLSNVRCPCGESGHQINVVTEDCIAVDTTVYSRILENCEPCDIADYAILDPCGNYTNCATCDLREKACATCPIGKMGKFCDIRSYVQSKPLNRVEELQGFPEFYDVENGEMFKRDASCDVDRYEIHRRQERSLNELEVYPIEVHIAPGESISRNRYIRSSSECFFPDHMDTAEIKCTIWPTYTKCNISCIWGHALNGERTVAIKCKNRDNAWKPIGFKECEPYVDCSLKLTSPGSVNCVYNRLSSPIECDIECDEYDDVPEVRRQTYSCTLQGNFSPPLPFCVIKANSTSTVSPPRRRR